MADVTDVRGVPDHLGTGYGEPRKVWIANATISDLVDRTAVFCYCGGELGRAAPDGADACHLSRRCSQCGTTYELTVRIDDPSAGELTILLKEREDASATAP